MTTTLNGLSLFALIAAIFAAIWMVSCGSGETHLTKAQFLERGNAICAQAEAEQVKLAARLRREEPAADEHPELFVPPAVVPPLRKELRRLRALNAPQGDEEKLRVLFREIEYGLADAEYDPPDLLFRNTDPFARANKLAAEYGLESCSRSSHTIIKPQIFR